MALPIQSPKAHKAVCHPPLSFESVYRIHFNAVWRLLRRLGVAPAQLDDAAQDVFLVVHRRFTDLQPSAQPRSWVFAIAVRVASEYRRRARRKPAEPLPDSIADVAPDPAQRSEMRDAIRLLHRLLGELDEIKRTVFVLSELEQLSAPEIADVLGVNLNTVYARKRAARKRFEEVLCRYQARNGGGERT